MELLGPAVAQVHHQLGELVQSGTTVVFDLGLGLRTEREEMKRQAGEWCLQALEMGVDIFLG